MKTKNVKITTLIFGGLAVGYSGLNLGIQSLQHAVSGLHQNHGSTQLKSFKEFQQVTYEIASTFLPYAILLGLIIIILGLTFQKYQTKAYFVPIILMIPTAWGAKLYADASSKLYPLLEQMMEETMQKMKEAGAPDIFKNTIENSQNSDNAYLYLSAIIPLIIIAVLLFKIKDNDDEVSASKK